VTPFGVVTHPVLLDPDIRLLIQNAERRLWRIDHPIRTLLATKLTQQRGLVNRDFHEVIHEFRLR
jgi:hypothetical protein